jgi:hypothetical protein
MAAHWNRKRGQQGCINTIWICLPTSIDDIIRSVRPVSVQTMYYCTDVLMTFSYFAQSTKEDVLMTFSYFERSTQLVAILQNWPDGVLARRTSTTNPHLPREGVNRAGRPQKVKAGGNGTKLNGVSS